MPCLIEPCPSLDNGEGEDDVIPERDPEGNETRHLHHLVNFANLSVLEVGCGDGRLTRRYAALTRQIAALDPDPVRLTTAVDNRSTTLSHVTFVQAYAEALPFQSERFDLAILAWSL
jgi:ubiquinone/menaquinone biosynthesis C-methylase UbiE